MPFKKGQVTNPKGRRAGVPNKITTSAKSAFMYAFDAAGGEERLAKYAKSNYADFIKIFSRLVPQYASISVEPEKTIRQMTDAELDAAIMEIVGKHNQELQ